MIATGPGSARAGPGPGFQVAPHPVDLALEVLERALVVHQDVGHLGLGLQRQLRVDPGLDAKLAMSLAELNLSVRAGNCLESENIHTVRDLVSRTEDQLLEVRNFGETTLNEVREKLLDLGLRLGMRLPPMPPSPL